MDPRLKAIAAQCGAFLRREALALGYDDRAIAKQVSRGAWVRVRTGAFVPADVWASLDDVGRRRVVVKAALRTVRTHVVVSHTSAADALGAAVWELPDDVHLTRTDGRAGRSAAGIKQHRGGVRVDDVTRREGRLITSGTRTALDITTIADVEHSLVTVNDLIHRGETSQDLLVHALETRTYWPHSLTSDLVVRLADGRVESVGESRVLFLCWAQGIPMPIPQYEVKDRSGHVIARVDFAWPELGVFLEFDGKVKYEHFLRPGESVTDAVLREKQREQLVCELTGWRCIRIVWADLYQPERTAARIRALFRPSSIIA
ncbi:hypothetical protein ACT8ZV_11445 [Nocardioides sp. MAHUQ-72]|uniref:hypothetical protein n=1 Tax=unclassified Nocardioides TaxID=2615069 RepID=UPI003607C8A3